MAFLEEAGSEMDRQAERTESGEKEKSTRPARPGSAHLMCRTPLWGVAGFVGCGYFAWISYARIARAELDWPHDFWTAATYLVWIILLAGLALDTRCARERVFFSVLVVNFVIGGALTLWSAAGPGEIRVARIGTGVLWTLGALASLTTLAKPKEKE